MPTIQTTPVRAYAHCVASRCPGNAQVEVDAIVEETTWLFTENGGDYPFPERSSVSLRFVNDGQQHPGEPAPRPDDSHCPQCGRNRDLSADKRPAFDGSLSGYDPNGLLDFQAAGVEFDPDRQKEIMASAVTDPEREAMQAEMAELRKSFAAVLEQTKAQSPVTEPPEDV